MAEFDQYAQSYSRLLDQSVALSGETAQYFADYKARYVAAALAPNAKRQKILDFGCGVGLFLAALRRHLPGAIQHGYDESLESIDKVDASLAECARVTTELTRLDHDYDAIVMAAVLHHVAVSERSRLIADVARRLAANGKLLVFEHNPLNPATRWTVRQCAFDRDAILLAPGEVSARLRQAGLRVVRREYIMFFPRLFSYCRPIERFIGWCPLGAQYVVTAVHDSPSRGDADQSSHSGSQP